jgi:hypothetical protein
MAKNKKKDTPIEAFPFEKTVNIPVARAAVRDIRVGDSVYMTVSGKVKNIGETYDGKGYELVLKSPEVAGIETNSADRALSAMKD